MCNAVRSQLASAAFGELESSVKDAPKDAREAPVVVSSLPANVDKDAKDTSAQAPIPSTLESPPVGATSGNHSPRTDMGADASSSNANALNQSEQDSTDLLCHICFEGKQDAVLLECGHGGICHTCAWRCFKKKKRKCPMCRQPVTQVSLPCSPSVL